MITPQRSLSFILYCDNYKDKTEAFDDVGEAICNQKEFERHIPPWEAQIWEDEGDDYQKVEIDEECTDRIYHCYFYDDPLTDREFEMHVRMKHKEVRLFVSLSAGCDFTGFDCQGGGDLFITRDPQSFLANAALGSNPDAFQKVLTGLQKDGYDVEDTASFVDPFRKTNLVPTLKFSCFSAIRASVGRIQYRDSLPPLLSDALDVFIQETERREKIDQLWAS